MHKMLITFKMLNNFLKFMPYIKVNIAMGRIIYYISTLIIPYPEKRMIISLTASTLELPDIINYRTQTENGSPVIDNVR